MLIPQQTMQEIDPLTLDVVEVPPTNTKPKLYKKYHPTTQNGNWSGETVQPLGSMPEVTGEMIGLGNWSG